MARDRIQANLSKGANKGSNLGSVRLSLNMYSRENTGTRSAAGNNSRHGLETLILASECTLVCKMMHTVARIIRIDRQWRSITVVVTGAKGMPRAGARNAESGQKKG